jgi:uncharacterized protein with GYD domain
MLRALPYVAVKKITTTLQFCSPASYGRREDGRRERWRAKEERMPNYVVLYKMTNQGAKDIQTLPDRVRQARAAAEQNGIKVNGWYLTMGQYDVVTIVDAPDEQTLAAGVLAIARNGNFTSESLRAFDESEMEQIIQKLG